MAAGEYILDLIKDLIDNQVKFIVCGGVAVVLHGVERMTMDLNLSVDMSKENLEKLLSVIQKNNLTSRAPIPPESLLDRDILDAIVQGKGATVFTFVDNDKPYKQLDIFITDEYEYNAIVDQTEEFQIESGYRIKVVSIKKLIEMKKKIDPIREKDLHDIKLLTDLDQKS